MRHLWRILFLVGVFAPHGFLTTLGTLESLGALRTPSEICCMTTLGYVLMNFNSASLPKIKLFYNFATQIGKVFGGSDRKITSPWQFSPEVPGGK